MLANNTEEYMHRYPNDLNITSFLFINLNRNKSSYLVHRMFVCKFISHEGQWVKLE